MLLVVRIHKLVDKSLIHGKAPSDFRNTCTASNIHEDLANHGG